MTDDEKRDLGQRALACRHWRPLPGMVGLDGWRYDSASDGRAVLSALAAYEKVGYEWIPDLTDPATLGCLLALVREAWGSGVILYPQHRRGAEEPYAIATVMDTGRDGSLSHNNHGFLGATEAEALVAALEAAP